MNRILDIIKPTTPLFLNKWKKKKKDQALVICETFPKSLDCYVYVKKPIQTFDI